MRDYLHVSDMALGHVKAIVKLAHQNYFTVNLGTGRGHSVLEIIKAFEQVIGKVIPYQFAGRREGDVAASYADSSLADEVIGWKSERNLEDMCRDYWRWQQASTSHINNAHEP